MLTRILFFCLCCGWATAQAPLEGGWQLVGAAAQQKMPSFSGDLRIFFHPKNQLLLQLGKEGIYELLPGEWGYAQDDQASLSLKTPSKSFDWEIQLLDEKSLVIKDLADEAIVTFSRIEEASTDRSKINLKGTWNLMEATGLKIMEDDPQRPKMEFLEQGELQLEHWPSLDSAGRWELDPSNFFLKLSTEDVKVYYEILWYAEEYLILRQHTTVFVFLREGASLAQFRQPERKLLGKWEALNTQHPISTAELIFRKDGTLDAISNLHTELNRWELIQNKQFIQISPYKEDHPDQPFLLRLRFLDKHTIILSDQEMLVIFQKTT